MRAGWWSKGVGGEWGCKVGIEEVQQVHLVAELNCIMLNQKTGLNPIFPTRPNCVILGNCFISFSLLFLHSHI